MSARIFACGSRTSLPGSHKLPLSQDPNDQPEDDTHYRTGKAKDKNPLCFSMKCKCLHSANRSYMSHGTHETYDLLLAITIIS